MMNNITQWNVMHELFWNKYPWNDWRGHWHFVIKTGRENSSLKAVNGPFDISRRLHKDCKEMSYPHRNTRKSEAYVLRFFYKKASALVWRSENKNCISKFRECSSNWMCMKKRLTLPFYRLFMLPNYIIYVTSSFIAVVIDYQMTWW